MPIETKHLTGPGCDAPDIQANQPTFTISRKRDRDVRPRNKDKVCWRHSMAHDSVMVMRAPCGPDEWLTVNEYFALIRELEGAKVPFKSARGKTPVMSIRDGTVGWINCDGPESRRRRFIYNRGKWVPFSHAQSSVYGDDNSEGSVDDPSYLETATDLLVKHLT